MVNKFQSSAERLYWLRITLEDPYTRSFEERRAAMKQAYEWVKTGVFGFEEFTEVLGIMRDNGYNAAEWDHAESEGMM